MKPGRGGLQETQKPELLQAPPGQLVALGPGSVEAVLHRPGLQHPFVLIAVDHAQPGADHAPEFASDLQR